MTVSTPGASIFVKAFRVSALTEEGNIVPGAQTIATKDGMKLTWTPVLETGDDVVVKAASGDIAAAGKHGDMIKYFTCALELAKPDPALEALCCGGTLVGSAAAALGEPSSVTATGQETLGTLSAGTYGYRVTQVNAFGESKATADKSVTLAGGTTDCVVIAATPAAGAAFMRIYGRTIGLEQLLGVIPNVGKQKVTVLTAKKVKAKTATKIGCKALTKSIPKGTLFQIAGDANSPKIIFKTLQFAAEGTVELEVEAEQEQSTEIAEGELVPIFVDTGAVTPNGAFPETDSTAGPGENIGYQAPALLPVASVNGVSIEAWSYNYVEGQPSQSQPYRWWAFPRVRYMHIMPRDLNNANTATIMEGQAFQNPNWNAGPSGNYPADTTKAWQWVRCGTAMVPAPSYEPTAAVA